MSSSSMSKKKEIPIKDTFFHLCYDLLRFIDRKIIKKYISPNYAQIPKGKRNNTDKKDNNQKEVWTYFYKDEIISEEEKIKDVFKDDKFLGYIQNLTNCLILVIDYLDQNMKKIKRFEKNSKYSEEKLSVLNDLKILLNNYFERTEENTDNSEQKVNNNILEDQKLMTIMNKIQSFNSDKNKEENDKINSQNSLGVNILDNVKCNIRSNDNNKNNNNTNNKTDKDKRKEKDNSSDKKEKNPSNSNNDNDKSEKYNLLNRCLETLSQNKSNIISIFNSDERDISIKEKSDKDSLVECNKLKSDLYKTPKIEKEDTEEIEFFNVNKKEEENPKEIKLLNKKLEREKESDDIKDDDKEKIEIKKDMNNIIINKKSLTSVKKKAKNKKKNKANNTSTLSTEKKEEKTQIQIPLKEDSIVLPLLKPLIEKKEEIKFEEKLSEKIENIRKKPERNKKSADREVLNIVTKKDIKNNNKSLENEFDTELKKEYYELNATNDRTKILRDIVTSMKTVTIENYNKRINGPYLVGSYKTISALPSINYLSSIDIMYTYKDMLLNKIIIDFTLKNIIETALNLNIIKKTDFREDENKITKINVKCSSKLNLNIIISFNILFVDIAHNINEQIISGIIYNEEKIKFSKKEDVKKFTTIILYLRTWRKKNHLHFIIPEIMDEYAKKHFESNKTMGVIIFNVFYDLYNSIVISSKQKTLYEKLIKIWFEPDNKEKINKAVLAMNEIVNSRNFKSLFKIEDENR